MIPTYIIVGASHAGAAAVDHLRRAGFDGQLILIGDEPHLPYQRPPLSKKFLTGELPAERLGIRQPQFYDQHRVDVRLNTRVIAIDRAARTVQLHDGSALAYDKLMLCLGGQVRKLTLPGSNLQGIHYLRSVDDVEGMRATLQAGKRMVVIGAGYVGLEVAASARGLGLEVTVLEMSDRCLNRVTAPVISEFYTRRHSESGVRLLCNTQVTAIEGLTRATGVRCADGTVISADMIVVGVGIFPATDIAAAAGLACDNGVVVESSCRTSDAHIYAAGDCTSHPSVRYGGCIRLESVDNAVEQARVAAANMCGKPTEHNHTPWFWSDQYEVKLQTAGLMRNHTRQVLRGEPQSGHFSVWYLNDDEVLAVDAINRPGDFMIGKRWIGEHKRLNASQLADVSVELKSL
ncbi:MAG: FAD-dependent oxidoreductase [Candidatus Obscuribacterales bacterium]|nr:FAD-dependent oxidoreductase [Steroidobacteraceae bacterium]